MSGLFWAARQQSRGVIKMATENFLITANREPVERDSLKIISFKEFRKAVIDAVDAGARLSALPVLKIDDGILQVIAVLSRPYSGDLQLVSCYLPERWQALTPDCPSAHWFEREIAETFNLVPEGHPWLKPIRFSKDHGKTVGITEFFSMKGEEAHEVAVGPVHAGVIEPGHFRFLCHGETVYHLEISLGYQHRGVERAMKDGPNRRSIHYMETLAGDTTIGHATAYCRAVESMSGMIASPRAEAIRAIAAELERVANHIGDLGALAGDIGFLPTMSYCGRIRGDALNLTALICGNRFGRGLIRPSGVAWDIDDGIKTRLLKGIDSLERDAEGAIKLMFDAPSVPARLEGTGVITPDIAMEIGLVGVAARACGLECDVRSEFPYGMYRFAQIHKCTWTTGDCFARAYVRWLEIKASIAFIRQQLLELPAGAIKLEFVPMGGGLLTVSMVEGWRGEICHVAATDAKGRFDLYKVVDPSFHNWFGLAMAMRNQQISDFPLCNKSFNLSYCGHDQ
jgi:Ni,Fe-hydrogenase III large subunit